MQVGHNKRIVLSKATGKAKILVPLVLFVFILFNLEYQIRNSAKLQQLLLKNANMSVYSYERIVLQGLMYNRDTCPTVLFGSSTFLNSLPREILSDTQYIKLFVMTGSPAYLESLLSLFPEKIKSCPLVMGLSAIDILHNYIGEKTLSVLDPSDLLFSISLEESIYRSGVLASGWLGKYSKLWALKNLVFVSLVRSLVPEFFAPTADDYAIGLVNEFDIATQEGTKKWGKIQETQSKILLQIGQEAHARGSKPRIYLIEAKSSFGKTLSSEVSMKLLDLQGKLSEFFQINNIPQIDDSYFQDEVHFSEEGRKILKPFWLQEAQNW